MFKILFLFFNLINLINSDEIINEEHTKLCLEQANNNNCGIFTNCCNSKCGPNQNQAHKCFSFMGDIQKDQTFCSCQQNNQQQLFNNNILFNKSLFSNNNKDNLKSSSSSINSFFNSDLFKSPSSIFGFSSNNPSSSSSQEQQNNNNNNKLNSSSFFNQNFGIQQRPTPSNPAFGRNLFLKSTTQSSSAIGLKRINKKDGNLIINIGNKIDFIGGIILLFVIDLLLFTLTI